MPTDKGISEADRKLLRAPFAGSAIRWLPIGGLVAKDTKQQFMPHINASLVFERLSEVDPSWTCEVDPMISNAATDKADPFGLVHGAPFVCRLTLKGVTRPGLGQLKTNAKGDDKHWKSVHSDAVKRAALAFELGAYLRTFETVFLPIRQGGLELFNIKKGKDARGQEKMVLGYLTDEGKRQLRGHYERVTAFKDFTARYGLPVEYGDAVLDDDPGLYDEGAAIEAAAVAAEPEDLTSDELDALLVLTKYNGRDTTEETVRETLAKHSFVKCLARVLNSVKANLLVDDDDGEKLRELAQAAASGDAAALANLEDGLEQLAALATAKQDGAAEPEGEVVEPAPGDDPKGGLF